jgi:protein gp37
MYREMRDYGQDPTVVRRTSAATWKQPTRWQRAAAQAGRVDLVFTCSWSDYFNAEADAWRPEAWQTIRRCPNLCFQILTKLPVRIADHLPPDWGEGYANVWLGVSIETNDFIHRADILRSVPARTRFISAEPLLGPLTDLELTAIDWLIVGGESGPDFRPMNHDWARDLRDRCHEAGVPFFFKQSAALHSETGRELDGRRHEAMPPLPLPPKRTGLFAGLP